MFKVFETPDFTIESSVENKILAVFVSRFPEFYCQFWSAQRPELAKLLGDTTGSFTSSIGIYDDAHHQFDITISKTEFGGAVFAYNRSDITATFSCKYVLTTQEVNLMLQSIVDFFGN